MKTLQSFDQTRILLNNSNQLNFLQYSPSENIIDRSEMYQRWYEK